MSGSDQTIAVRDMADTIRDASVDESVVAIRIDLARFTAATFEAVGKELQAVGQIFGTDRRNGLSPQQNGSDEVVALGLLLRIGGELISASTDLFVEGRHYAAAALLRQLVEVEYLAWAFETRDGDAERWLRSTREERRTFFTPAKLRGSAGGKFRAKDYGYHCELGGHPVPGATALFRNDEALVQLLLADTLGHASRIWSHIMAWALDNAWAAPVLKRKIEMLRKYQEWKAADPLNSLPPPP